MKKSAADAHIDTLIHLANEYPDMRDELIPIIQNHLRPASERYAHLVKEAFKDESGQFVAWCIMEDKKWSPAECQRLLDRLGVPFVAAVESKKGPLEKGEQVKCVAMTNANPKNTDVCEEFDNQVGSIIDIDGGSLIVKFQRGGTGRFDGLKSGKETGLGRFKESIEADKRAGIEVVYISDKDAKPPSKLSLKRVREYVEKGLEIGESRSDIYHAGIATVQTENKEGQYYVKYRDMTRGGGDYRSFNPTKGQVLYLGTLGHRPGSWKNEFAKMVAEDAAKGEDKD